MSRKDQVALLLEQGTSYAEAARKLGISRQAVHEMAKRHQLEKIWKEKEQSGLYKRKENFLLGKELYGVCSLKFSRKKQNCKQQGTTFSITFDELEWPTHCPILGIPLIYETIENHRQEGSPSFDKIDPLKGYVSGNVRIISWRANRIKNDGTADEHRKIANYIDSYDKQNVE